MKIYTKTGDKGKTSLIGGARVFKHDLRLEAYGTIDELIAWVGLLKDYLTNENDISILINIQNKLMITSALLATDSLELMNDLPQLKENDIVLVENEIDRIDKNLLPLTSFILPGGHKVVSYCHITRTVCRRAERIISNLSEAEDVNSLVIKYVNRLSDYFFTLSRKLSKELKVKEIKWEPEL